MFKKITVIGAGLMGSAIAAHFTNAGCEVTLLDIVNPKEKNKNFNSDNAIKKIFYGVLKKIYRFFISTYECKCGTWKTRSYRSS